MNKRISKFISDCSYTILSNLIALLVSTLVVLIVPKLIGVNEYSYLQLYLFYSSYVGFMQFGWNDGIYLRYGGEEYERLNKKLFFSQFWMLTFFQVIVASVLIIVSVIYAVDINRQFILIMVAFCTVLMGVRAMILFILQATNRIKEYAHITMLDRILYVVIIILFLMLGIREYKLIIIADLLGKLFSLLYAMYSCKEIVLGKITEFNFTIREAIENISVGIKLMFANIASMLIIGIVRFGIERTWDILTFGKISLALSISNLMMLFINAVGIIMFPILRRTDKERLSNIYLTMRDFLMVVLMGALIVYYPLKVVMLAWLPQYKDGLMYMALVFPMFLYEGKMALLINTYLKTLRKEKLMLRINLISLGFSLIITLITTQVFRSLTLSIASIVILLAFRCALAETFLAGILKISIYKDIFLELGMTMIFILTGWFLNSYIAVLICIISYIAYLLIKKNEIIITIKNVKLLVKN